LIGAVCTSTLFAQTCVSVKQVATDYQKKQVTINVSWSSTCTGETGYHRNNVWVFVDYRDEDSNSWTRATVSSASVSINGVLVPIETVVNTAHSKGVWISSGTNTTKTVTLDLSDTPTDTKYDWCAFATDYPPNISYTEYATSVTLKGTAPFRITYDNDKTDTVYTTTFTAPRTISSFTDATGRPGVAINCPRPIPTQTGTMQNFVPPAAPVGDIWLLTDTRDNKPYNVVKMPDNRYWMAQNLDFRVGLAKGPRSIISGACNNNADGIGYYFCYDDDVRACDSYGTMYTWYAAMMVDGRLNAENGTSAWSETSTNYCTGAPNTANCNINHGKGTNRRGICPPGWHVPTDYEWAYMLSRTSAPEGARYLTSGVTDGTGVNLPGSAPILLRASCEESWGEFTGSTLTEYTINNAWSIIDERPRGTDTYSMRILPSGYFLRTGTAYGGRGQEGLHITSTADSRQSVIFWSNYSGYKNYWHSFVCRRHPYAVRCVHG